MPKITDFNQTPDFTKLEEAVQKFWQVNQSFEKSVEMRDKNNSYVFYDGPPFATGLPHYGHLLASTMKDVVPRYWTMRGKRVERKWGWDCHGLPIENIAEKELGITEKKEIVALGVEKFNEICRSKVLSYVDDWKVIIKRLGRWADMENDYKTMDLTFMESVWWVFKELYDQGLIYEEHRSMHICPRCETTLSQSEVAEGYQDVTDLSVVAKFKLTNSQEKLSVTDNVFVLAWTTTPWTLPGNFLLAVNPNLTYVLFRKVGENNFFLAAEARLAEVRGQEAIEEVRKISGQDLVGLTYQPLFPYYADTANAFRVVGADFVSAEDGTGVVHIAPGFGEDDYKVGKNENVELIQHLGMNGRFVDKVTDFAGLEVKPKDSPQATDIKIIKYLAHHDLLWSKQKINHSYPHCWRCDTPLLNYATSSYFVAVTKIKAKLIKLAEQINWSPEHIKTGRWGNWLKGAKDWSISRQRFWASVIPVWKCECGEQRVYGSVAALENDSGLKITDLHKHVVDQITMPCPKCGKTMHRVADVLDTWFDSGSMPYGQAHYPFANKELFEQNFPAEFIGEGADQTRAWFYYLHVIAGGIKDSIAFKNVIVNGIVLAEDGKKMSKHLLNYPDPAVVMQKYGADSLRLYLASSTVLKAEDLNFSERAVSDLRRKVFVIWWNILSFYQTYTDRAVELLKVPTTPSHVLDRWLVARLAELVREVTENLNAYDLVKSSRVLIDFISDLSNWYLRLSRERLKNNPEASQVLGHTLYTLAQLYAPFAPFFSETIHHTLVNDQTSIHHTDWPEITNYRLLLDEALIKQMVLVKKVTEMTHALRKAQGVKLRQPLSRLTVVGPALEQFNELQELLTNELNVKTVTWRVKTGDLTVQLDFNLTPELEAEGEARELMRAIQSLRKEAQLTADQIVTVEAPTWPTDWQAAIEEKTKTKLAKGESLRLA